ncbi:MAG: NADPH-dependent glutamate synthase [Clostridiales bacterium]|nr:NADPH-dependent glutamate synthase [Clostridiales bacterium]
MPLQDPKERANNFKEVAMGYTAKMADIEASRCIECKNPRCVAGCPVNVDIPGFIRKIKDGDIILSHKVICETNSLPAVCGRVCPQEEQCEEVCVLAIKGESVAIGRLERYVADFAMCDCVTTKKVEKQNGIKMAVIGAGPAGLTCAGDLARLGYVVTIFEAFHKSGGVLVYGIPEFRLPKDIVAQEIQALEDLGVQFEHNTVVGKTISIEELFEESYQSVFIGSGAGLPRFMNIEGESLIGVYSANEYLTRINLMGAYKDNSHTPVIQSKKAVVVGGGNVAMDAARCALRMGAETSIVYRRSMEEMPAREEEIHHAIEEGIDFNILCNPTRVFGKDGRVDKIECIKMELGEPDDSGRRRPKPLAGSEFTIDADMVIIAIGTNPNPILAEDTKDLKIQSWGGIITNEETGETSIPGVYAGGDAVTGAATVIKAMGAGKIAAEHMDMYVQGNK